MKTKMVMSAVVGLVILVSLMGSTGGTAVVDSCPRCSDLPNGNQEYGSCEHVSYDHRDMVHDFFSMAWALQTAHEGPHMFQKYCGECDQFHGAYICQEETPGPPGGGEEGAPWSALLERAIDTGESALAQVLREGYVDLVLLPSQQAIAILDCAGRIDFMVDVPDRLDMDTVVNELYRDA